MAGGDHRPGDVRPADRFGRCQRRSDLLVDRHVQLAQALDDHLEPRLARVALGVHGSLERHIVGVEAVAQDVQLALLELDAKVDQVTVGDAVDLDRRNELRSGTQAATRDCIPQLAVAGERVVVGDAGDLDAPLGHRRVQLGW